jgi:hypothetical protein
MTKRKIFWLGFALLAFILLIPLSFGLYEKWQVYTKGNIVNVTITSLPGALSTNGTVKFRFQGRVYAESMNGATAKYFHFGDTLQMKHLDGYQIFLFENDRRRGWNAWHGRDGHLLRNLIAFEALFLHETVDWQLLGWQLVDGFTEDGASKRAVKAASSAATIRCCAIISLSQTGCF